MEIRTNSWDCFLTLFAIHTICAHFRWNIDRLRAKSFTDPLKVTYFLHVLGHISGTTWSILLIFELDLSFTIIFQGKIHFWNWFCFRLRTGLMINMFNKFNKCRKLTRTNRCVLINSKQDRQDNSPTGKISNYALLYIDFNKRRIKKPIHMVWHAAHTIHNFDISLSVSVDSKESTHCVQFFIKIFI